MQGKEPCDTAYVALRISDLQIRKEFVDIYKKKNFFFFFFKDSRGTDWTKYGKVQLYAIRITFQDGTVRIPKQRRHDFKTDWRKPWQIPQTKEADATHYSLLQGSPPQSWNRSYTHDHNQELPSSPLMYT